MMTQAQQERSHLELISIYEICRILGASLDIDVSFREALNVLAAYLGLDRAMIVLDNDECELHLHSSVGLTHDNRQRGHWQAGEGVIGHVYSTGMPVVVPDVSQAPEFIDRTGAFGAQSDRLLAFLVVPMKTEHSVVGVLAAQREVCGSARLSDDVRVLTMLAALLAQRVVLHRTVRDAHQRMQMERTRLQKALTREPRGRYSLDNVVGVSRPMQQVFAEVHQAAPSRATVLLRGESGTGKEAIARAVHYLSPRKDAPFIKVNCAALTESLLESELFGHERGAFTGAAGDRKGRFELAHGGTLFLDEVGDISPGFQAKLLRVLQEREFERVGGNKPIKVDVRLICATNRDLEKMVQRGEYRADLYYRINVVSIFLPALRERRDDIPPLVNYFLERFNKDSRRELRVTPEAMKVLTHCYWPGNVRELENCIERTATMAQGELIHDLSFPCKHNRCLTQTLHYIDKEDAVAPVSRGRPLDIPVRTAPAPASHLPPPAPFESADDDDDDWDTDGAADEVLRVGPSSRLQDLPARHISPTPPDDDRDRLIWALEQCGWVQAKAARLLKVTPRQLGYALQKHRIEVRKL
ncbi:MAG: hypothetical protein RLY71_561 [Pseudomonadota bacterium]|jgi:Nif-specific regulatory protein